MVIKQASKQCAVLSTHTYPVRLVLVRRRKRAQIALQRDAARREELQLLRGGALHELVQAFEPGHADRVLSGGGGDARCRKT